MCRIVEHVETGLDCDEKGTSSSPKVEACSRSCVEACSSSKPSSRSSVDTCSSSKKGASSKPRVESSSSSTMEASSRPCVNIKVEAVRTSSNTDNCMGSFERFPLREPNESCLQCHGTQEAAPQILPCGHVYCSQCLDQLGEISRQTHKLPCPSCKASFSTVHPPHHDLPVKPRILQQFSKDSYASDSFLFNSLKNNLAKSSASVVGMDMIPPHLYVVYERQEHLFKFDTLEDTTSKSFMNSSMTPLHIQKMNPKGFGRQQMFELYLHRGCRAVHLEAVLRDWGDHDYQDRSETARNLRFSDQQQVSL